MKEDFLHYVWEFQKWESSGLTLSGGSALTVLSPGMHNFSSGPDFFNSQLVIGDQKWAGNVEIHINSSDWYAHHHETDPNYDNVILHVVWKHDSEVFRKDNSPIPVLEVASVVSKSALANYQHLLKGQPGKWINCEQDFWEFEDFFLQSWLERLYFERLEGKAALIGKLLDESRNNWEEVLFKLLARSFGLNVNGEAFLSLARALDFNLVRRLASDQESLEALFLGMAGLLDHTALAFPEEGVFYFKDLQERFQFLEHKHKLKRMGILPMNFFRLRPDNFPNIRLSQLAALYHKNSSLFSEVIRADKLQELYEILEVSTSDFWESHYTFEKGHRKRKKKLSRNFMDLLIINTLVPLKFCYAKTMDRDINEELLLLMGSVKKESNRIIDKFEEIRGEGFDNALQTQALLHLKKQYCDNHQCLRCHLGVRLLQRRQGC